VSAELVRPRTDLDRYVHGESGSPGRPSTTSGSNGEFTLELDLVGEVGATEVSAIEPLAPRRPGTLVVALADEKGKRVPLAVTVWRIDGSTRMLVHEWLRREVDEALPPLEEGEYAVTVRPAGEEGELLLPVDGEETVEVRAGEERRLTCRTKRGGRLLLDFSSAERLPQEPGDRTLQAALLRADGAGDPLRLQFQGDSPTAAPRFTVELKEEVTCEPALTEGNHVLYILSQTYAAEARPVEIVAGERTRVEVELFARKKDEEER